MRNDCEVILDIETLDSVPGAAILAIAAVAVSTDPDQEDRYFNWSVELDSSLAAGLTVSEDTFEWWLSQSLAARSALVDVQRESLRGVLCRLTEFITEARGPSRVGTIGVWGNGADFDNACLQVAYRRFYLAVPWGRNENRCYRTIRMLYPKITQGQSHKGAHIALEDAKRQAEHLGRLLREHYSQAVVRHEGHS